MFGDNNSNTNKNNPTDLGYVDEQSKTESDILSLANLMRDIGLSALAQTKVKLLEILR